MVLLFSVQLTLLQKTEKLGGIGDNGRGNQKRDQHRDVPDERSTNEIPLNISTRSVYPPSIPCTYLTNIDNSILSVAGIIGLPKANWMVSIQYVYV